MKRNRRGRPVLASALNYRGSRTMDGDGTISAYSKREALDKINEIAATLSSGTQVLTEREAELAASEQAAEDRRARMDTVYAISKGSASVREEAGNRAAQELAGAINESVSRIGFLRSLVVHAQVDMGEKPEIYIQRKNVITAVASGPAAVRLQIVRDNSLCPPEVDISTRLMIEGAHINRTKRDLLAEKYEEGVEHVLVSEDTLWKKAADNLVSQGDNDAVHTGDLTSRAIGVGMDLLMSRNMPLEAILFASNMFVQLTTGREFEEMIEPTTRLEIIRTGKLGTYYGAQVLTDGFREERLKVLDRGDTYFVSNPQLHGEFTDRGGVTSQALGPAETGINGAGWHINEAFSIGLVNHRSVARVRHN